ncbi:MAG: hypothetical protein V4805_05240, partial [Pseudomonadota bacterium]
IGFIPFVLVTATAFIANLFVLSVAASIAAGLSLIEYAQNGNTPLRQLSCKIATGLGSQMLGKWLSKFVGSTLSDLLRGIPLVAMMSNACN